MQAPEFAMPGTRADRRVSEWVINQAGNTYLVDASYVPERHWEYFTRHLFTYESRPFWLTRGSYIARRFLRMHQVTTFD